ncbi:MAG: hypoxanthine phosphoribosyltransferase [Erysipelotrichaceae bacterium]|nr:hypoxanthine phosphoribosyltransferase [Erysipelotrichaceae bacterium]
MHKDVAEILVSEEQIQERCKELGKELSDYYRERNSVPMLVGLLKGSVPFLVDLIKRMDIDVEIDFMDVSSYAGTNSVEVRILKDIESSVADKDVLVIEDIVDTGKTLEKVCEILRSKGAREVKIATLLDKPGGRKVDTIVPDYVGFSVPNKFVIGYGLDYNQKYRNLPYVGVIKEEAI